MTDEDVNLGDVETLYGAMSARFMSEGENEISIEELKNYGFRWGDEYLESCLNKLVEIYEETEKIDNKYIIHEIEQEKHMEREDKYRI